MYKLSIAIVLAFIIGVSFSAAVMADTQTLGMTKLASANPGTMNGNPCAKKKGDSCKEMMENPCAMNGNPCGMKDGHSCEEMEGNPCGMKHHNPCDMQGKNPCGKK